MVDPEFHWAKNNINFESARAPLQLIGMNKYIQASIAHKRMDHTKSVIALGGTKLFTDTGYFIMSAESALQPISKHFRLYTLPETNKFAPKKGHPKRKRSYSNHLFLGANLLLVSGRVSHW